MTFRFFFNSKMFCNNSRKINAISKFLLTIQILSLTMNFSKYVDKGNCILVCQLSQCQNQLCFWSLLANQYMVEHDLLSLLIVSCIYDNTKCIRYYIYQPLHIGVLYHSGFPISLKKHGRALQLKKGLQCLAFYYIHPKEPPNTKFLSVKSFF